jgi:hypothetical protein
MTQAERAEWLRKQMMDYQGGWYFPVDLEKFDHTAESWMVATIIEYILTPLEKVLGQSNIVSSINRLLLQRSILKY